VTLWHLSTCATIVDVGMGHDTGTKTRFNDEFCESWTTHRVKFFDAYDSAPGWVNEMRIRCYVAR